MKLVMSVMVHRPCESQGGCEQLWNLSSIVNEKSLSRVWWFCKVMFKFGDNVVGDSHEWSNTSARTTVFHGRQPLPSSANEILHTNLAPERGLTEQGHLCVENHEDKQKRKNAQDNTGLHR